MSEIKLDTIQLDNGQNMLVEVVDIEISEHIQTVFKQKPSISDLPDGAEVIGIKDDIKNSMTLLKDDLKGIASSIKDALNESSPDEFSVEISIGFAGKGAIPFIASAESNAGLKIKATWKKGS